MTLSLKSWNLGYSVVQADHWLVLESSAGKAWIARGADACAFLQSQLPRQPPLRMVDLGRVREKIDGAISQQPITAERLHEF